MIIMLWEYLEFHNERRISSSWPYLCHHCCEKYPLRPHHQNNPIWGDWWLVARNFLRVIARFCYFLWL